LLRITAYQEYKQQGLFSPLIPVKEDKPLMAALDKINDKWGRSTIQNGMTEDQDKPWSMLQTRKSPAYTTNWNELPVVKAATS
jgi:DNA polymerase V